MHRCLLILALWSSAAFAGEPAANPAAQQQQELSDLRAAMVAHRNTDVIALADKIITDTEARYRSDKRTIYSGQNSETVLMNMLGAAVAKTGAVDVGPAYGFAYFAKSYTLEEMGREDEAGASLDRAVSLSPQVSQFLCEDAFWHAHHRDLTGALKLYQECEANSGIANENQRNRWKAAGLRGQGFVLIEMGKLDEAESRYKQSLKIEPNDSHALGDLRYITEQRFKAAQPH